MKFRRSIAPQIFFLLSTVLFRLLFPLQYYFSLSGEPLWKLTSENRPPPGNTSFVFLVSSSDPEKLKAGLNGWLKNADGVFVFSSVRNRFLDSTKYSLFRLKTNNEWVLLRAKALFSYYALPLHADWIVLLQDDSLVLIDQLKYELRHLDFDEQIVITLGTHNFEKPREPPPKPLFVFSRQAFKQLGYRVRDEEDGCGLSDSLATCLHDARFLDLTMDNENHYRYHVMNRHFSTKEMKEYTKRHGEYDDGYQIIHQLSSSLLTLHNLEVDDIRILDVLLNRVRLWSA